MVDEAIAKELNLTGLAQPLCLRWTSDQVREEENSQIISFEIAGQLENKRYQLKNVRTVKALSLPKQTIDLTELQQRFPHLSGAYFVAVQKCGTQITHRRR